MNEERWAKLQSALDHILQTLISDYQPIRIILFGSMATGNVHEWSDLDLVIIKETDLPFFSRLKQVALLCDVWVGTDYLVYTPKEFQEMIADNNLFIVNEIIGKGKVLYEHKPVPSLAG